MFVARLLLCLLVFLCSMVVGTTVCLTFVKVRDALTVLLLVVNIGARAFFACA